MFYDVLSSRGWNTLNDFDRLWSEVSQRFGASTDASGAIDISVNDDETVVAFAAPGLDRDSIEVTVLGDTLTVRAKPSGQEKPSGEAVRQERANGTFQRSVRLPFAVDDQGTQAAYRHGVLTVQAQRAASTKPRRIAIEAV